MRRILLAICLCSFAALSGEAPLGPPATLYGKSVEGWVEHLAKYENETQRTLALFCISEFGAAAANAVPELRKLLKEELQPAIPGRVVDTLGCIGPPADAALPDLVALYNDNKREAAFRGQVLGALSRINPHHAQARRAFQNALKNEDPELRHAALNAAVNFSSVEQTILQSLTRALTNPEDTPIAARSLSCLGAAGINVLIKALEKGDAASRVAVAEALAPLGSDAVGALPQVLRLAARDANNQASYLQAAMLLAPNDSAVLDAVANYIAGGAEFAKGTPVQKQTAAYTAELRLLGAAGNAALPAIRKGLRSPVKEARESFVALLAQLKDPPAEAIDDLVGRAQDKDESVQRAAIKALDAFGPRAAQAKTQLEEIARTDAAVRRVALLAALNVSRAQDSPRVRSTFDSKSIDDTLAALKSADASERRDAVEGLRGRKEQEPAIAAALLETLKDADVEVRSAAARALSQYGAHSAPTIPIFSEWVKAAASKEKPDANTILLATGALAGFAGMGDGAKPALETIISLAVAPAVDGEKDLQKVVALCLRIIGTDSVAPLTAQFKSEDANARRRAAEILAQMGVVGATAIPELLQLSNSAIESDARAAFSAIEAMGTYAYPLAAASLADTLVSDLFAERRRYAAQTLGGIGIPKEGDRARVLDAMQQALLDPDEAVCRTAHGAMVRIGDVALPRLKEMLEIGEGAASYWWAVRALARMKAEPDRVIPLLIDLTRPGVRTVKAGAFAEQGVAAELLSNYAPERTEMIPALLRCLEAREEYLVNAAVRTLKLFGPGIVASVKPMLSSTDPRVRQSILHALVLLQTP